MGGRSRSGFRWFRSDSPCAPVPSAPTAAATPAATASSAAAASSAALVAAPSAGHTGPAGLWTGRARTALERRLVVVERGHAVVLEDLPSIVGERTCGL